jgi:mRNA interferase MazF
MIRQFDVWIADLNPSRETVPGKISPVVIIQTDGLNKVNHPSTSVLPITTNVFKTASLLRVNLLPNKANGLSKESAILTDQIRTVDNRKLIEKIGSIDFVEIHKIKEALKIILAL